MVLLIKCSQAEKADDDTSQAERAGRDALQSEKADDDVQLSKSSSRLITGGPFKRLALLTPHERDIFLLFSKVIL